jgi:hypothetical protein
LASESFNPDALVTGEGFGKALETLGGLVDKLPL